MRNVRMKRIGATTKDIYVRETGQPEATDSDDPVQTNNDTADKEDTQ